jgi:hypothetical protein
MVLLVAPSQPKMVSEAIQAGIAAGNINIHTEGMSLNMTEP